MSDVDTTRPGRVLLTEKQACHVIKLETRTLQKPRVL